MFSEYTETLVMHIFQISCLEDHHALVNASHNLAPALRTEGIAARKVSLTLFQFIFTHVNKTCKHFPTIRSEFHSTEHDKAAFPLQM